MEFFEIIIQFSSKLFDRCMFENFKSSLFIFVLLLRLGRCLALELGSEFLFLFNTIVSFESFKFSLEDEVEVFLNSFIFLFE